MRDWRGCVVGDVPVEQVDDHFAGDIGVEFFDWFSNVAQKGVTGSAADHHDKKHWTTTKEHRHCSTRADGVSANLVGGNVEGVLPNCQDGIL